MSYTISTAIAVISFAMLAASSDQPVSLETGRPATRPQRLLIVTPEYANTVTPPSAADVIAQLESAIAAAPGVSDNLRHPLTVKLDAVLAALAKNKAPVACVALGDFRDQVVEKRGKGITGSDSRRVAGHGQPDLEHDRLLDRLLMHRLGQSCLRFLTSPR